MKTSRGYLAYALTVLLSSLKAEQGHAGNLRTNNDLETSSTLIHDYRRHHRILQEDEEGILLEADFEYEDDVIDSDENNLFERRLMKRKPRPSSSLNIELSDGSIYELTNIDVNWRDVDMKEKFFSGRTRIKIRAGAKMSGGKIDLDGGKPEFIDIDPSKRDLEANLHQGNRHLAITGAKKVLAVRVIASDAQITSTEDELSDGVFGTFGNAVNLKSQMEDCSYNQLSIDMADDSIGDSTSISNGVVSVTLTGTSTADGDSVMRNAITAELTSQFGTSPVNLADHVLYCLPSGTMSGIAYAYIDSWMSVYSDQW